MSHESRRKRTARSSRVGGALVVASVTLMLVCLLAATCHGDAARTVPGGSSDFGFRIRDFGFRGPSAAAGQPQVPGYGYQCGPNGCRRGPNPAACRIRNDFGREAYLGSGTLIDKDQRYGLVVTCQHIFRKGKGTITCSFPDGNRYKAVLLNTDGPWDLAALLIVPPKADPVTVASVAPKAGDTVTSCGYGPDGQYWCNRGRVTGYVRTQSTGSNETLELTGRARDGDSGGPVFNTKGQLVAVLWGTDGRTVGGTYCGRVDKFLLSAGRYLLPWNARNNNPNYVPPRSGPLPQQQPPQVIVQPPAQTVPGGCPAVDLSGVNGKLDRIADILMEMRKAPPQDAAPPLPELKPIPAPQSDRALEAAEQAKAAAGQMKGELAGLKDSVNELTDEQGGLFSRLKARIEEARAAGAESAAAVAKSVVWGIVQSYGFPIGAVAAVVLFLVYRDIRARVTTGDPLLIEKVATRVHERLGPVRERIVERVGDVRERVRSRLHPEESEEG